MEELHVKAGINAVTNYIKRLKKCHFITISGEMAFFMRNFM